MNISEKIQDLASKLDLTVTGTVDGEVYKPHRMLRGKIISNQPDPFFIVRKQNGEVFTHFGENQADDLIFWLESRIKLTK